MFQSGPIRGLQRKARCCKDWPVSGSRTARASRDHWLLCRTSEAAHPCKNFEGKVRIESDKGETLRQELVRCAMGVGGLTVIGTSGYGWCTLGDWRNIGNAGILGCRSAKGRFCLNRTSRIERTGVLRSGAIVAGDGVARGLTTPALRSEDRKSVSTHSSTQ